MINNDSFVNTEDCWSYTEKTEFIEVSASIWFILIILQCVFVKIIPAIAIVTMNIMIIIKVIIEKVSSIYLCIKSIFIL